MRQRNFMNEVKFDNPGLDKRPGLLYSIFIIVPTSYLPSLLPSLGHTRHFLLTVSFTNGRTPVFC